MDILGVSILNIVFWVIFGFIVGFIVHLLDPADVKGGIVSTTILGILGAIVGGFVSNIVLGVAFVGFSIEGFLTAVIGGLLLAFLSRVIFRDKQRIKTFTGRLQ